MSEPTFEGGVQDDPAPDDPTPTPEDRDTGTYAGGQVGTPGTSGEDVAPAAPGPVDPAIPEDGTDLPDPGTDDGSEDPPGSANVPV